MDHSTSGSVSAGGDVRNFLTSFGSAPARGSSLVVTLDRPGDLPIELSRVELEQRTRSLSSVHFIVMGDRWQLTHHRLGWGRRLDFGQSASSTPEHRQTDRLLEADPAKSDRDPQAVKADNETGASHGAGPKDLRKIPHVATRTALSLFWAIK